MPYRPHLDSDVIPVFPKGVRSSGISYKQWRIQRGWAHRGGSRRGSLGGGGHTGGAHRGGTVILGLFLVFVKPIF